MTRWTQAGDLKAQLRRLWERGELLRELIEEQAKFPLRLTLKGPGSAELVDHFESVRIWVAQLTALSQLRFEWREFRHRILGTQRVPQSAWVDSLDNALALLGKQNDATRFRSMLALTRSRQPALLAWLAKRPLRALDLAGDWERLLDIVDWVLRHPRPDVYLRQVDIPGIHSKFIETHRGVLVELLDIALPPEAIDNGQTGVNRFTARYGFHDKPVRIRLRILDPRLALLPGPDSPDVSLDAASFARLDFPVRRVFITENEINFLAFPPAAEAIVIFGAGYGWDALAQATWLRHCALYYWGDIDTHGFAILDQLRRHFPQVESFLMDQSTLLAHQDLWDEEANQVLHDLPHLTDDERALFDELRDNRIRKALRLEQERVGFHWVEAAVGRISTGKPPL